MNDDEFDRYWNRYWLLSTYYFGITGGSFIAVLAMLTAGPLDWSLWIALCSFALSASMNALLGLKARPTARVPPFALIKHRDFPKLVNMASLYAPIIGFAALIAHFSLIVLLIVALATTAYVVVVGQAENDLIRKKEEMEKRAKSGGQIRYLEFPPQRPVQRRGGVGGTPLPQKTAEPRGPRAPAPGGVRRAIEPRCGPAVIPKQSRKREILAKSLK